MKNKVITYIQENHMIEAGDTVVAGVSGGADSVCLLLMLLKYRENCPFDLIAAHVHHGLRANADGDEAYVRALCDKFGVPLRVLHIDAKEEAKSRGVSVEEAGRICRYDFFGRILAERINKEEMTGGADSVREITAEKELPACGKIAVAHHRDDLCETILFQMFRGSGLSGLRGILPVSGNVIRPLLDVSRQEIEEYLTACGVEWRTDESNEELIYARNRIRHEILPVAEEICSGAGEHMAESAKRLREIEEYIASQAKEEKAKYFRYSNDSETSSILLLNPITSLPKALLGTLVLQALCEVAGKKRDIGQVQVDAVIGLFSLQVGRRREFLYGLTAKREYEGVRICLEKKTDERGNNSGRPDDEDTGGGAKSGAFAGTEAEIRITDGKGSIIPDGGIFKLGEEFEGKVHFLKEADLNKIPTDSYTKWINCDTINNCLLFRHPEAGDYMVVTKEGGQKKLRDYFVNEKIPAKQRSRLWVLADGNRILWVVGYRIGEDAKITPDTECVLEIILL